jgi:hypothetical protein
LVENIYTHPISSFHISLIYIYTFYTTMPSNGTSNGNGNGHTNGYNGNAEKNGNGGDPRPTAQFIPRNYAEDRDTKSEDVYVATCTFTWELS